MSLLSKFRKHAEPVLHTVIITVPGRHTDARLRPDPALTELEDAIIPSLEGTGLGDFDIVESTRDSAIIHLSGRSAEQLFLGIRSTLESLPICQGARVLIRQGEHGAPQREAIIDTLSTSTAGDANA